jgi:uncharacterized protein (DUF2141 family)
LIAAAAMFSGVAFADSAPSPDPFARFAAAGSVVLAVQTASASEGGEVRLSVYDSADNFLEMAAIKHHAQITDDGVAILTLRGLKEGEYAFVAYHDQNGDGKLNRSFIGAPTEPLIFSNNVRPKLRKPTFEETKVNVRPGSVVVMTIDG